MSRLLIILALTLIPALSQAKVIEVKSAKQHEQLMQKKIPTVVMLGAPWCEACKEATPEFAKAEKAYKGKVRFLYINIDNARPAGLSRIPAFMIGGVDTLFNYSTLDKNKGWDEKSIIDYVTKYTGIKP